MALGTSPYTYELVPGWPKLPLWWEFKAASDVAVNSQDRVYVFSRGMHPVTVFERDGTFVSSWGEGMFRNPHGIYIGPDDSVWLVDRDSHVVMKFTPDGKLLTTLGQRDAPAVTYYGQPFNMPSGVAIGPSGHIYVSDGYGNRRVHKFTPDGKLVLSWGEPGTGPGQFALVHNIAVDQQERVYICDRENNRIQVFDANGKFITEWRDMRAPGDIYISPDGLAYVAEQGGGKPVRISIWTLEGRMLSAWDSTGLGQGTIVAPHGIWVDSRGDIYVAEIGRGERVQKFARRG